MKALYDWRSMVLISLSVILVGGIGQKTLNALKVRHILRKIEVHKTPSNSADMSAEVTETELNDYIDHRLTKEKNLQIKSISITLLGQNRIKGKLNADGEKLQLSTFFGDRLEFNFNGVLHTRKGAARLDLKGLKLNGHPITPQVLDLVIRSAAMLNGTEYVGINDWHVLPQGIKRIQIDKGKAILYY